MNMKYFLSLISAILLFTACSKDDDGPAFERTKASRAVLIFMAGENNLTYDSGHRFLKDDLLEMAEGSKLLSDNQRVLVFVDSLGTNNAYKGTPFITEVHGGKTYNRKIFDTDFYSCDPAMFREIVSWMTTNVEADSYALVMWGHASGWLVSPDTIASASAGRRAYALDTNGDASGIQKWMNITQMAKALDGLPKMDFIFADCCNMMCAEVGYELRNATNYLIGSPAEIPGSGAPYNIILPYFFKNGSDLYKGIIDTYYDYYLDYYTNHTQYGLSGYSVPLSVIDTKYMEQLAQQTKSILTSYIPPYPQVLQLYGLPYYWITTEPILYDMRAIIRNYVDTADLDAWENVYKQAVPYYRMSGKWMTIENHLKFYPELIDDCGCVSMFIPQDDTAYTSGEYCFNKTCTNFGWNRVMDWSRFGW